jgi:hypothetical protein
MLAETYKNDDYNKTDKGITYYAYKNIYAKEIGIKFTSIVIIKNVSSTNIIRTINFIVGHNFIL